MIVSLLVAGAGLKACISLEPPIDPRALFVTPNGNDSNLGTERAPLQTIGAAAKRAVPGSVVHVAPGTYRENVKSMKSGTAVAPIRYVSTVKWGAKIIGGGTEAVWENHGEHVEIAGFDVSGSGRNGILNYGSWVRVINNHVHDLAVAGGCSGNGGGGIVFTNYQASDGEISGNLVHDIGVPGACAGVQGIYYSNLRGKIYNNIVYRASAWGIHLWHAANKVVVANNTVFANGSSVLGGGIVVGTGDAPGNVVMTETKVINNIVVHNPRASIRQYCYTGESCIGADNLVAHNVVFQNGRKIEMLVGKDIGTITQDPLFVDFRIDGKGDYRLRSSSPARKRGLASLAPPTDMEGISRPRAPAVDIGAYQQP
ncbi:right-handed parallel beta-helix repeat-containing protein [Massilia sp. BSC265]|uniref:right-handed parallel beta-helix repeat-containing protein n=1 Tax=Massilia sp. BSC265 TaxID=1549812 RepID=UPI0006901E87|nr:right-handed parallel beta-helix repeat-containing protein [Massilia sp. BSC265]